MKRLKLMLCMFCLALLVLPISASADMGPKPSLTVYVTNAPDELYYLDLLVRHPDASRELYGNNITEQPNEAMVALLFSLQNEGWVPALAGGTDMPLIGNLVGVPSGSKMKHSFSYYGVPDEYRIILVSESGQVVVSDVQHRVAFPDSVTVDFLTGAVKAPPVPVTYAAQLAVTLTWTLLIEGALLFVFGISIKKNWKAIVLVNVATQLLLTATVGVALVKYGLFWAFFIQFPIEILIIGIEMLAYRFLLRDCSNGRRVGYAAAANALSWVAGLNASLLPLFVSRTHF